MTKSCLINLPLNSNTFFIVIFISPSLFVIMHLQLPILNFCCIYHLLKLRCFTSNCFRCLLFVSHIQFLLSRFFLHIVLLVNYIPNTGMRKILF